jgi:hypothetical protein
MTGPSGKPINQSIRLIFRPVAMLSGDQQKTEGGSARVIQEPKQSIGASEMLTLGWVTSDLVIISTPHQR